MSTILAWVAPVTVAQRGADLIGFDAAMAGRAGVDVAIAETVGALLTNPAGLTRFDSEWRVDFTARAFLPRLEYQDDFNSAGESSSEFLFAPSFAAAWNPNRRDDGRAGDLRLALGIEHVAGNRSRLDLVTQDFADGTARDGDYIYTGAHFGVAIRLTERVAIGATLSATWSDLDVRQPLELPVSTFGGTSPLGNSWGELLSGQLGIDRVRIDGDLDAEPRIGFSATFGLLIDVSDTVAIGLRYRTPEFVRDYDANVDVDISRIFGEPDPTTFPDGFAVQYDAEIQDFGYPQAVAFGVAWRPCPEVRVAAEVTWVNWSSTHRRLRLELRNGDNPGFNDFVGSTDLTVRERLAWRDQISVGVAVEWTFAAGWVARIGGMAQTNPVRDDAANPSAPGWARYHLGLGLGWRNENLAIDAAWLHTFEATERVGTSVVSSDLDGSRQSFGADSFLVSVALFF